MIAKAFTLSPVDSDYAEIRFADGECNVIDGLNVEGCGCCGSTHWNPEGRETLRTALLHAGLAEFPWPPRSDS